MTDKEKNLTMKSVYKRAGLLSKKKVDVKYVVSKRGQRGGAKGQKGPYKIVDKRMKKDKMFNKKANGKKGNKLAGNKNGKPTKQKAKSFKSKGKK